MDARVVDVMETYGGNFVRHLAACWRAADLDNQRRLVEAFRDYFTEYEELAHDHDRAARLRAQRPDSA